MRSKSQTDDDAVPPPSRAEVVAIIDQLVDGTLTREDAQRWADPMVWADHTDEVVDDAVSLIAMFDERHVDDNHNVLGHMFTLDRLLEERALLMAEPPDVEQGST